MLLLARADRGETADGPAQAALVADVHKIIDWTANAAIHKADAKGVATNTLSVDASKPDSVRLLVNGAQVHALEGTHLGSTGGFVGLRVNHNLDVHISDFVVTPTKK